MRKKILLTVTALICVLILAIGLAACGDKNVAVQNVTLSKTSLTLEIDETATLTATVTPENATDKTVSWHSTAPAVASVDHMGKVTAKTAGTATVTATADGKSAKCEVTVKAAPTKMTEQEWQTKISDFASAKNFHLTLTVSSLTAGEVKMNGGIYYDKGGNIERIFVKDGSKYYRYDRMNENSEWTKADTTETVYNEYAINDCYALVTAGSQAFVSNYASFNYSDGKYTADTISVATGFTLKDIEITVTGGAITKIVCTQVGTNENPDTLVTIDGIGTTEITLPKIKEPTSCVQYRIPKNKDYAEVSGYSPKTDDDLDVIIDSTYEGKPVTVIKSNAFSSAYLTSVVIPDSVTTIEGSAFADSKQLAKVTIPDSVISIGYSAFKNTAWYNSQPDGLVYAGKVAYAYKGDKAQLESVTIAEGTVSIAPMAFYECENLITAVVADSVTDIGNSAFEKCINLKNVKLGSSVANIGASAFVNCGFESIKIPDSVVNIGQNAFKGSKLKGINVGSGVQSIGAQVFEGCPITTINYDGTQDSWNAIKKAAYWDMANVEDQSTIRCTIHCTDGDIVKED